MRKKLIKSVNGMLFLVYCLFMMAISATCVAIYNLTGWVMDTWGLLSIDEIIFHLTVPIEGTNSDVIMDGINACLPLVVLIVLFMIAFAVGMRKHKLKLAISLLLITCICAGSGAKAAYQMYSDLEVGEYLRSQKEDNSFIETNYVDPRNVQITFPEEKEI